MLIDGMSFALVIPIMPTLISEIAATSIDQSASLSGWMTGLFGLMQILFASLLGALSDRYGRRPVLLISLGVVVLDYSLMAFASSVLVLFIARLISGIATATTGTAFAYMADISPAAQRSKHFGLLGAAFGLGFVLGPALGGVLSQWHPRTPLFAAAALSFATLLLGIFVLGESLTPNNRRRFSWQRANPFGALLALCANPTVGIGLFCLFAYNLTIAVYPAIWSFFALARFDWSALIIGISLSLYGIGLVITQGLVIRWLTPYFSEARIVVMGLMIECLGFLVLCVVENGLLVLCLLPIAALANISEPALKSMLAAKVKDNQLGELMAATTVLYSISAAIAAVTYSQIFAYFTAPSAPIFAPYAPFVLASGLSLALIIFFRQKYLRNHARG